MAHQYTCSACAFQIRSDDDEKIIELVQEHADEKHDIHLPRSEVTSSWESDTAEAND